MGRGPEGELVPRNSATAPLDHPLQLLIASTISPCGGGEPDADASLRATIRILRQRSLIERIAGGRVSLTVMVPPSASPAVYGPTAPQMRALRRSDLDSASTCHLRARRCAASRGS